VKVKITWKAFGNKVEQGRFVSSVHFDLYDITESTESILNSIYKATNLQSELADFGAKPFEIYLWNVIEPRLAKDRTHTSLSVGDEIEIDGQVYVCADFGWVKVEDAEIKFLPDEYGIGAVFSVTEKVNS
jgi:hypothetical protein